MTATALLEGGLLAVDEEGDRKATVHFPPAVMYRHLSVPQGHGGRPAQTGS